MDTSEKWLFYKKKKKKKTFITQMGQRRYRKYIQFKILRLPSKKNQINLMRKEKFSQNVEVKM